MRLAIIPLLCLLLGACSSNPNRNYHAHRLSQKTFQTKVGPLAYRDEGEGSAIILLHGVPTSSWLYRKVISGLSKNHRVIAVDLIGYGSSAKPQSSLTVYEPARQARRVRALAQSLNLSNYSVVCHDMGGLVAWEMMHQDHTSIDNLIVLNTIVNKKGFYPPNLKVGLMTETLAKVLTSKQTNSAALAVTLKNLGLSEEHGLSEGECSGYVQPLREGSQKALTQFYSSLNQSLYNRLKQNASLFRRYQGNTLILWGGKDKILTSQQIPFLTDNLRVPEKNVHIYPQHDHFLAEENPDEFVHQVTSFLAHE